MQNSNNIEYNIKKLAEIRASNPKATHVYFHRIGDDGLIVDVPIEEHAMTTIKQHPKWLIVASNKDMDEAVDEVFETPDAAETASDGDEPQEIIPPKPSEIKKRIGRPRKNAKVHRANKKA